MLQPSSQDIPQTGTGLRQDVQLLYSNHRAWLYHWLRKRLGCPHHAADLLQDTYLRILVSGQTPSPEQARPHLMQIAKGLVIDRYRRQQIEQAYLAALAQHPEASPRLKNSELSLSITNIADRKYVNGCGSLWTCGYGLGRQASLTFSGRF
ncbi:sigma factor [Paracandidimonas soli]|uniref:Sigma-70-like protein n=1 Tax=Paracandidimonas soli TaxID=1917182 RepID=A0A4R3USZ1_9BURK|nr:sigma factor [Paracandidimonas soli]TCU93154.1 sigma-70-like protein [Paracandidimonas soli]